MNHPRRAIGILSALLLSLLLLLAACGGDDGTATDDPSTDDPSGDDTSTDDSSGDDTGPSGRTLAVPEDHDTIQAAVDAAEPGDLILIAPGVYNEAVDVETDNLTIRGLDRNEVILDGEFELENGIRVLADGVAVENMTSQHYTTNGFYWSGATGYRGSYLTAYRNGLYGIYAFDSVQGQFDNSYAAGSPDAGFYIGQCYPCDALIIDVISEYNGLGYSGTNAGGNLLLINSRWNNNRAGIVPNSGSYELCYPQRDTTVVGNVVYDNNQPDTPAIGAAILAMGNGIIAPGGINNLVERNLVFDHDLGGITLVPFPEEGANDLPPDEDQWDRPCDETRNDPLTDEQIPDEVYWQPIGNIIRDNVVSDSRIGDLAIVTVGADPADLRNCWADNTAATSAPAGLESLAPCDGDGDGGEWVDDSVAALAEALLSSDKPESVDYEVAPTPPRPDQPNMPDVATAPARPATDVPESVDLDAIEVPERPAGL